MEQSAQQVTSAPSMSVLGSRLKAFLFSLQAFIPMTFSLPQLL